VDRGPVAVRTASLECHPGTESRAEPGTGSPAYGRLPPGKAVTHAPTPAGR